jgi:NADPH:quinone reductase-like Zn-dependent oxidoreductase
LPSLSFEKEEAMRAFALEELGAVGSVVEVPVPEPTEGQVRIRVAAAGLNPFDNAVIQGYLKDHMEHRFPLIPGSDASGTVEALGDGVTDWAIGAEVFGSVGKGYQGEGTLAELATMSTGTIARKPASVDHTDAAAIPVAGVTALTMVEAAAISEGGVVVAIGATGGVGSYLVKLAAARGARVIAISSAENADTARKLGASDVVDYAAGDVVETVRSLAPDGIDVIAELHGGDDTARLAELVRSGGRVVSAVGGADEETLKGRGIEAANVSGRVATGPLGTLVGMLERGEIVSPEIRNFTLEESSKAFEQVGSGHTRGKIVVTP